MRVVAESGRPLKKGALKVLIVSVGISAFLGVLALLTGDFGEFQLKVLFTAMTVAGASIIALACGAALELGRARVYAPIGIWSSVIGAALALLGLWFEIRSEALAKIFVSAFMLAVFAGHASALSAANVLPRHHWVRALTVAFTSILLAIFFWQVWGDFDAWENLPWRLVGVLIVLASAGTILVPVLARMGRDEFVVSADAFGGGGSAGTEDIDPGHAVSSRALPHCPHCGEQLPARLKHEFPA